MSPLSLDQKMEIAYGVKLNNLDEVVAPKQRKSFKSRLHTFAFWRDDMAIMLLVSSIAIMAAAIPWEPFDPITTIAWFIGFTIVFAPAALFFTLLIMLGFGHRGWTFARVFSASFFLCLAYICMMATYFP